MPENNSEITVPDGLHWVNMNGMMKLLNTNKAFDRELQSSMNFFPCTPDGKAVSQPFAEGPVEVKKNPVVPERDPEIIIPDNFKTDKPEFVDLKAEFTPSEPERKEEPKKIKAASGNKAAAKIKA